MLNLSQMPKSSFCKQRAVPIALQEDLSHAYDAGIKGSFDTGHFHFQLLEYGDSSPSIATAGGVDAQVRRSAPVHHN